MTHETTTSVNDVVTYGRDDAPDLNDSLRRATWMLALFITALVTSLLIVRAVRVYDTGQEQRSRALSRVAVATELAATTTESALRLYLVTGDTSALRRAGDARREVNVGLVSLDRLSEGDTATERILEGIGTAVSVWEREFAAPIPAMRVRPTGAVLADMILRGQTHFDIVRSRFDALAVAAERAHAVRLRSLGRTERASLALFLLGTGALAAMIFQLIRRLRRQAVDIDRVRRVVAQQNSELRLQAVERELQQIDLQTQTAELETALADLRALEERERELLERTSQLNRRLAEAQQVAQLGYWEIDSSTGEVFWSDEMYRLCGVEPGVQPVPTDHYIGCVHPEDRSRLADVARRAMERLEEFTDQYRMRSPDGTTRTVLAKGRIIIDGEGKKKLVGTVQDVSDRVALESQLRQAQKMEAIGTLAGGVAHDFNNILTVIMSYAGILLAETPEGGRREELTEISRAAARAAELTRQLLTFSRQQVTQMRRLSVNDVVSDVERMLRRLIPENITLRLALDEGIAQVDADPAQLEQVLVNLAVNARDAMPEGGELTIQTRDVVLRRNESPLPPDAPGGRFVMLIVRDTGHGMDDAVRSRIFEPFFTTKETGRGTGLGLSTVYGIVQQSQGHISVTSEPGRGTTFTICLPAADGDAAESAPREPSHRPRLARGSGTILIVEDELVVRQATRMILSQAGYTVIEAANGVEALDQLARRTDAVDLVITDMIMPGMNGRELADRIRTTRPEIAVLVTSGYTDDAVLRRALVDPRTMFMQKPYSPQALTERVREALAAAGK